MNDEKNIEVILKLFDQVKDSSDKGDRETEKLSMAIRDMMTNSLTPSHKELKEISTKIKERLDDHVKDLYSPIHDIKNIKIILEEIKKNTLILLRKIKTMIIVVVVAFALMVVSYLFVSNSVKNIVDEQINIMKHEESYKDRDSLVYDKLKKLMEKIEKEDKNETPSLYK